MKYASVIVTTLFVLAVFVVPADVFAQPTGGAGTGATGGFGTGATGGAGTGATGGQGCPQPGNGTFVLCNPLSVDNFCDLIKGVLNAILAFGIPIATLFLVWAGFKFILARGRPAELEVAKRNFYFVIIGIAVFLGAWTFASIISATIQQLDKNGNIKICSR